MKNQAILIKHKNEELIVSNVEEALSFVRSLSTSVEGNMLNVFIENFNLFLKGEKLNSSGANTYSFGIGGNSGNPHLFLRNVTGLFADKDLKKVAYKIVEIALKKHAKTDLKLNVEIQENAYEITGGSNWYWAKWNNCHYPVNEVFIQSNNLNIDEQLTIINSIVND